MRTQWTAKGNRDAGSSCSCDRGLHRYLRNFGGGGLNPPPPVRHCLQVGSVWWRFIGHSEGVPSGMRLPSALSNSTLWTTWHVASDEWRAKLWSCILCNFSNLVKPHPISLTPPAFAKVRTEAVVNHNNLRMVINLKSIIIYLYQQTHIYIIIYILKYPYYIINILIYIYRVAHEMSYHWWCT